MVGIQGQKQERPSYASPLNSNTNNMYPIINEYFNNGMMSPPGNLRGLESKKQHMRSVSEA